MSQGLGAVVAYADHAREVGGAEVSLQLLLQHLDRRRFRPLVLHAPDAAWLNGHAGADGLAAAVFTSEAALRPRRGDLHHSLAGNLGHLARSAAPLLALRRTLVRERPVILHSNTLKCHLLAGAAARTCGVPVLWHLRDIVEERGARAVLARAARILRPTVIAISDAVAREATGLGLTAQVIHNGVALDAFTPGDPPPPLRAELGLAPRDRAVMIVARLTPWKGHQQLLRAMPRVLDRFPEAKLVVVGTTGFWDPAYADELRRLAESLGVDGAVVWTGHREDVPALLRLCEVFVLPSKNEPFGRVLVEAMATGKPVVAGRTGGVPEICPDGECGHLVDPDCPREIAEGITALLAQPKAAVEMGRAGKERAHALFDARRTAERVQAVYEETLLRHGRRGG